MGPVLGLNQDVSMVFRIHREVSFFSKPAQLRNLPSLPQFSKWNVFWQFEGLRQIPSAFFIPNLAPLMAAGGDKVLGVPSTLSPPAAISGARFGIKKADGWRGLWSVSTWGPGPSLGLQFQGLIVSRYKVTTGVGGRNGKKHSGNSVWLPEVSYSTVNETSLKVYGCVWEYPQLERFIIILPMTMAVWGCISPSSETAKQDFHLWYPKNKKTHRDLTKPPKHQ